MRFAPRTGLSAASTCLILALFPLTGCGGDNGTPATPTTVRLETVSIDTIFTFDTIFGPDDVIVISAFPEGCSSFKEIEIERTSNRLVFNAIYEFSEPCSPLQFRPAGKDTIFNVELEYERFSAPGEHFLVYTTPDGRTVSMPITVLGPSTITNIRFEPEPPDTLAAGDSLKFLYDYATPIPGGVTVHASAFWNGNRLFNRTCLSPILPIGRGSGEGCVFAPSFGVTDTIFFQLFGHLEGVQRMAVQVHVRAEFTFTPR